MTESPPATPPKDHSYHAVTAPAPVRHASPPRSAAAAEPTGAAQFISNLSERQRAHLQFAVPAKSEPERFSQFLETPRRTPVPDRFTFDSLQSEARRARESSGVDKSSKLGRGSTSKSTKSNRSTKSHASSRLAECEYDSDGTKSRATSRSGARSRATSVGSMKRASTDLMKEMEHIKTVVNIVDWKFYSTGCCLCLVNLVMAWDSTAISIALPTIATALHGSTIQSFWLGISFFLAATVCLPLFSAFSDIFGRKAMLLTGLTFFTIGSFIAAVSGNLTGLHLGRSVQGIGAGGIVVLSDLIVSDLVDPLDKRRWSAILGAMWAIGAVTGPVLGEALAERSQWRWIFWLNLPFCVLSFLILPFLAQLKGATPGSIAPKLRNFDWVGCMLLCCSLVAILLGISWGGTLYSWSNPRTLLPLQFGFIGVVVFGVWSWFSPFPSLISLDGFMDRTAMATYFGTMIQSCIICGFLYFLPLYFAVAKPDLSHLASGVRWLPWTLPLVFFVLATFIVVSRWNTWLLSIWLGWFLVLLGVGLTTVYSRTTTNATWVSIAIVLATGVGILYPSLHTASELIVAQQDEAKTRRAVTNYAFFQLLGKACGVTMATSIFGNQLLKHLRSNATFERYARQYANDAVALVIRVQATAGGKGSPKEQIADAYVDSLRAIWTTMAVLAGLALVVSCFMMPKESDQSKTSEVEMKPLEEDSAV